MKNKFEHQGFTAQIEYSNEDNCFVGRVQNIEGLVLFSGESVAELQAEFIAAVDEYIAARAAAGLSPERAFSGTFNVRVGADLHRKAQGEAARARLSLNEYVKQALAAYVARASDQNTPAVFGNEFQFRVEAGTSVPGSQSWDVLSGSSSRGSMKSSERKEWIQ